MNSAVIDHSGKVLKIRLFILWGLIVSIVMVPLFHVGEIMSLLDGSIRDQVTLHTWLPVIVVKNMLLPLIVALALAAVFYKKVCCSNVEYLGSFVLLGMATIAVLATDNIGTWQFLAGVRWLLPLFLVFLFVPLVDKAFVSRLVYVCLVILGVNFAMQLWELGHMHPWWGVLPDTKLAARTPGFFSLPSTSAMFACFSVLFSFLVVEEKRMKWVIGTCGMFSVFLTQSGTGFCAMLIVLASLAMGTRWRAWFPVIVLVSYELTKLIMPYFRGEGYYHVSLGGREDIFLGSMGSMGSMGKWLFGADFGAGTSAAWLLKDNFPIAIHPVMTDSLLTQFLVNLGGIGLLAYLLLMVGATLIAYVSEKQMAVLWLTVTGIFSVTTPITEAFPMNMILAVAIAYLIRTRCFSFDAALRRDGT